jgi:excisionase family DNA binding protein
MATVDSSSLSRAVEQLKRDIAVLRRQVRELSRMLTTHDAGSMGPPAGSRKDFVTLETRAFREVVMTVAEAGETLGLGDEQIRRLLRADKLAGVPLGGRAGWQVSRDAVMKMVAARQTFSKPRTANRPRRVRSAV